MESGLLFVIGYVLLLAITGIFIGSRTCNSFSFNIHCLFPTILVFSTMSTIPKPQLNSITGQQGKVLKSGERKLVYNVHQYFDRERIMESLCLG